MNAVAKPQGCTNFKLRRLMRQVARHYDLEVAKSGLKTTQYSLLSQALHLGPVRPVDLAHVMGLDASTLTRNLKPMIAAGWLIQTEGPDARSRLIEVTEGGRKKRAEAQRHWRIAQEKLNELLGPERILALHALVDDSVALMQAADETGEEEPDD
jgi:DNA-binding MarR family transcriptional regulator